MRWVDRVGGGTTIIQGLLLAGCDPGDVALNSRVSVSRLPRPWLAFVARWRIANWTDAPRMVCLWHFAPFIGPQRRLDSFLLGCSTLLHSRNPALTAGGFDQTADPTPIAIQVEMIARWGLRQSEHTKKKKEGRGSHFAMERSTIQNGGGGHLDDQLMTAAHAM